MMTSLYYLNKGITFSAYSWIGAAEYVIVYSHENIALLWYARHTSLRGQKQTPGVYD